MTEPAAPQSPIAIRPADAGDLGFILKSWLLTERHSSHTSWFIESDVFFEGAQSEIKAVLARPTCRALVACPSDDPEVVLGFLVYEPEVVHFAYVKSAFRRARIATMLLSAAGMDPSAGFIATSAVHDLTKGWMRARFPNVRFNPYPRRVP